MYVSPSIAHRSTRKNSGRYHIDVCPRALQHLRAPVADSKHPNAQEIPMRVAQSLCPLAALVLSLSPVRAAVSQPAPAKPAASAPAPAPANRVTYLPVKGVDYEFSAPDQVASGIVVFNLTNAGADLHALALLELPANHTLREFLDMYHSKGIIPPWMPTRGQTGPIAPNQETFLTVRLKPGRYILACLIPARDGRAHTEKGMVRMITVK
jgi:uncharacterized cupredoxin-like copper-binding protein